MTTMVETWPEPSPEDIARRLRMYMGDIKLSRNKLAMASGIGRTALSSKLDGLVDFTVPELVAIARAIGKSWVWVVTGEDGDGGPDDGGVRPKGFEPLTFCDITGEDVNGQVIRVEFGQPDDCVARKDKSA